MIAALVLFSLGQAGFGLDPGRRLSQYVVDAWGPGRGFVGGEVFAIAQSADGYLWIGTERGLVRFDGYQFTLFQQPILEEPPTGPVRGLVLDGRGDLWIRLEGARSLLYRNGKFEDASAVVDLDDMTFTASAADGRGGLLLAGLGDRTLRYHDGHLTAVIGADRNPGTVISLAATRDGETWLGTQDNGLFRAHDGSSARVSLASGETKVNALLPAKNGGLWIGTDRGVEFWDKSTVSVPRSTAVLRRFAVFALLLDHDSNVWLGTNRGLVRITPTGAVSVAAGKPVTALFEDRDGDLWFGGSDGITRLRDGTFTTYSTADGLPSDHIGPIYADTQGRIWLAPISGGLYWMRDGKVTPLRADGLDHDVVYSIDGGNGQICIGRQRGGLTVLTPHGDAFAAHTYTKRDGLAENTVYAVRCDGKGAIWAGTVSAGVSRLSDRRFKTYSQKDGLASNTVNAILTDTGTVWVATVNGLSRWNGAGWRTYSNQDGLPSSNVGTIFEDSEHVIWIATPSGLALMKDGVIEAPRNLPEALREQVFGIAEDGLGALWMTTSDHVLQVNRERLLAGTLTATDVQSYGIEDGLEGEQGTARNRSVVADAPGRIWMSLNQGLSVADPEITANNAVPVAVRLQSISADGRQMNLLQGLRFTPGTQSVTINFDATNLSEPDRIRFRYKLDGSDRGWSDTVASRQVDYSNLSPGDYRFRVVASDSKGLWNGPETEVSFAIEPALYQTLWFRILGVMALALAGFALYRLRLHQVTRQLDLRFQDRLAERTRIAQDLHDTLLQGVLSASLQLDLAEERLPDNSPAKPLVRRVLHLMNTVTEEGRNALRGLRTGEAENSSLENAFARIHQELAVSDRVDYRVTAGAGSRPLRPVVRDEVYRIGREALINAFRHANATTIEVEVEYSGKCLRVVVRDDGKGLDPEMLQAGRENHWGLAGMRERSERIGASLRLKSRSGAGTEMDLTVPGPIAFENSPPGRLSHWFRREPSGKSKTRRNRS